MTEDEAKTKWCPHAGDSRMNVRSENCLGSACMAWRWTKDISNLSEIEKARQLIKVHGYCGKAGKP